MNPNPYEVSEPELLRGPRVSWRGGFLRDRPDSRRFSWTFHLCHAGPIGSAHVPQGGHRSDLKRHEFSPPRRSVSPTTEVGRTGSFKTLSLPSDVVNSSSTPAPEQKH